MGVKLVMMLRLSHPSISVPDTKALLMHGYRFPGQSHWHVSSQLRLWQPGWPEGFVSCSPSRFQWACPGALPWKHLQTVALSKVFVVKNTRGGERGEVERSELMLLQLRELLSSSCTQLALTRKQHLLEARVGSSSGGFASSWTAPRCPKQSAGVSLG